MRYDLTVMQVQAVMAMLGDELADDEALKLDTLEGETDLFELVRKLLDAIENAEGEVEILAAQMAARKERRDRAAKRIEAHRRAIMALMECAHIDKLPLPEATCSLRKLAPKAIVTDASLLPDALCKIERKPDMAAIRACPDVTGLPGVALDNGGVSLTVRRS
jgi:hypothetical protein